MNDETYTVFAINVRLYYAHIHIDTVDRLINCTQPRAHGARSYTYMYVSMNQ